MKRICVDARMLDAGGIGTYLHNLLFHLRDEPLHWDLLVYPHQISHLPGHRFHPICVTSPIYSLEEQWELSRKIPSCDLFWSPHYNIPLFPIRAKRRLTTLHDVYHLAFAHLLTPLQKLYAHTMIRAALYRADQVITVSQFSKQEIQTYTKMAEKKIEVIPSGVCLNSFSQNSQEKKITPPRKFLLFVGNNKPRKNLQAVLKAFSSLPKAFKDFHLLIVGNKTTSIENRKVHFLGKISSHALSIVYRKATALLFPSFYEGFGFPPLEAMSFGCPVILSRSSALPEICEDAGYYIDPYSPQTLQAAILQLLHNPSLQICLKQKGENQVKKYSWEKSAQAHLSLIKSLIC